MNSILLSTLRHRIAEIDESLVPLIDKAMEDYSKEQMVKLIENISRQPIDCYSEKVRGQDRRYFLGRKYVNDLINRIKSPDNE